MDSVREDATSFGTLLARWKSYVVGGGMLEPTSDTFRLINVDTSRRQITNAQIDDYQGLPRRRYRWQSPLTMTVRAWFSHPAGELRGTAGFGFWNDPFMMTGRLNPALPRAMWFFYASPPSDIKLDLQTPGSGWKAATIDAARPMALAWAPLAPLLIPLMNWKAAYHRIWPCVQRALGICEAPLPVGMTAWHTYVLACDRDTAQFLIDDELILTCPAPRGRLGFVMWIDNQYMRVKPWGRFGYGWIDAPGRQWMEIQTLSIVEGN